MASKTTPDSTDLMQTSAQLLGPGGPIADHLTGFTPRSQQQAMAAAVARTLGDGNILVCEAGTGTGKTLAYLAPALLHGDKVVISTGTRTLQDQLFHRDIPLVRKALGGHQRVAMLKGRANYLCLQRFEEAERSAPVGPPERIAQLIEVRAWAQRTRTGEVAEVTALREGDPLWPQLTSTTENCLGQSCPRYEDCHVVKARQRAQEADVLVINHHLLFSDILLRQEGFGELLPDSASFIIDEAHQLPEIASNFFGIAVSGRQLIDLGRDAVRALKSVGDDMPWVSQGARQLERQAETLRRCFGDASRQVAWSQVRNRTEVAAALVELQQALDTLDEMLEQIAARDKSLEHCWRRSQLLRARLRLFSAEPESIPDQGQTGDETGQVSWLDCSRRTFVLRQTPMDYAATFRTAMEQYQGAWVFTSATLAVGDDFSHFSMRLGIDDARTEHWDSPFDYPANALLYLPPDLPEPGARHYTAAAVEKMIPVLEASGGRAFVLFTSHRALQEAAAIFNDRDTGFPLLVQGTLPHSELLERFRAAGNAVLLGTGSFWEGVDVRGPMLSCVIIDKLPFAPPDDPVFQARAEQIRQHGGNPFRDYQLPNAIVALKQGVGRLIRDTDDRGVLVLCDPRLVQRSYGRIFLRNIPPMRRSSDLADVRAFFALPAMDDVS